MLNNLNVFNRICYRLTATFDVSLIGSNDKCWKSLNDK